jgi:hypothetical protein
VRLQEIKTFRIGDAFILLVLGLGTLFFTRLNLRSEPGTSVRIILEDHDAGTYSLAKDTVVTVNGALGKTVVNIMGGAVWISSAPCPQQTCVHQGKIRLTGQIVVCVPNRVCVEIKGSGAPDVDGITM